MAGRRSPATARSRPSSSIRSASARQGSRSSLYRPRASITLQPHKADAGSSLSPAVVHDMFQIMSAKVIEPAHSLDEAGFHIRHGRTGAEIVELPRRLRAPRTGRHADKRAAGDAEISEKPHHLGHRERLRQRFRLGGATALPDYELLELILFRAIPRQDVKPLAKALIARFGSFAEAISASPERLKEVPGVGEAVITEQIGRAHV